MINTVRGHFIMITSSIFRWAAFCLSYCVDSEVTLGGTALILGMSEILINHFRNLKTMLAE